MSRTVSTREPSNALRNPSIRKPGVNSDASFKKVSLILKRNVGNIHVDEPLGEITSGTGTFTWKPSVSNFDIALVTSSNMYLNQFLGFLKYLGAETHAGIFSMGSYLPNNFLLSDGPAMNYTLSLDGEKGFFMHEKDETKLTLNSH